jgi:hypothetical protein
MGFSADTYVTFSADPSCSPEVTMPPCVERGRLAVDAVNKTLTLTSEAGRTTVRRFDVLGGDPSGVQTAAVDLTQGSAALTQGSGSLTSPVGKFSLTDPSNQVALTKFEKFQIVCKIILLVLDPLPPTTPPPAPAAISQQQCDKKQG